MIVGIGTDLVSISRFAAALRRTPALAERLITPAERAGPDGQPRSTASLAARFAAKEAAAKAARKEADPSTRNVFTASTIAADEASGVVEEHIGPVQFNMGGIHVNADEMVKRLQDREASRSGENKVTTPDATDPSAMSNDKLMSFFSGLINKGGANSPSRG